MTIANLISRARSYRLMRDCRVTIGADGRVEKQVSKSLEFGTTVRLSLGVPAGQPAASKA